MSKKIIYKKDSLLGGNTYGSSAMQDILEKDQKKHILNQKKEKTQLFKELKKYRDGGLTRKELKGILAGFKYSSGDYFDTDEINTLAKELNLGNISKKHLLSKSISHTSMIDRANHDANYSNENLTKKKIGLNSKRELANDDIVNFEAQKNIKRIFGDKYKKMIVDGDMAFENEQEEMEFIDRRTGRRFMSKSSQLKRPSFRVKSQTSLRGRGLVVGSKIK